MIPLVSLILLVCVYPSPSVAFKMRISHRVFHNSLSSISASTSLSASNIIVLDHLNINHAQNTHCSLLNFYVSTLGMTLDSRKIDNVSKKYGTVWVNGGASQFHLSEGKPHPQVIDGRVVLNVKSEEVSKIRYVRTTFPFALALH